MFIARKKELEQLSAELNASRKATVLVYGKRRIGKSTLIGEAMKTFDGTVVSYLCAQSTLSGNLDMFTACLCEALGLPAISFRSFADAFAFLGSQQREILVVIDEYQYLKAAGKRGEVDSYFQAIVDALPRNVKLVLCGSYVTVMRELLEEENPLFGRFTCVIHLMEMDYYDASLFFPKLSSRRKLELYAAFGGSPYVLSLIDPALSLKDNICKLLLPETGTLRIYIESVMLKEVQKAYDVRILEALSNGKKKYSEIAAWLGADGNGLLDKQLKSLQSMETIEKTAPINKQNDKKKQFYSISDNLLRLYFAFIFNRTGAIARIGERAFYDAHMSAGVEEFVSRRFEGIVRQFFSRRVSSGKLRDVQDIGTYWYDNPEEKANGEFDCVLKRSEGYDVFECKFYKRPMTQAECERELEQVARLKALPVRTAGFVCSAGFTFENSDLALISGDDLFA